MTLIKELVHQYYWQEDLNCARSALRGLERIFDLPLGEQIIQASAGLHGAGGYRAQCGLVEGPLLFLGLYGHKTGSAETEIVEACYRFAEGFEKKFGSLRCRELRPGGFAKDDPPHACEGLTVEAIEFAVQFISGLPVK
ncbi:redox-active protein [Deltaproteobacteria bacterium Smac51]|nr:redox-active protein [Deltaproteobacteria bacterium Smac51]